MPHPCVYPIRVYVPSVRISHLSVCSLRVYVPFVCMSSPCLMYIVASICPLFDLYVPSVCMSAEAIKAAACFALETCHPERGEDRNAKPGL